MQVYLNHKTLIFSHLLKSIKSNIFEPIAKKKPNMLPPGDTFGTSANIWSFFAVLLSMYSQSAALTTTGRKKAIIGEK